METSEQSRTIEALLFASDRPLSAMALRDCLPADADIDRLLGDLQQHYCGRGVNLVEVAGKWMFQTAPDLAFLLRKEVEQTKRLSRAAVETLAIIAYHQPVTRPDIEEVRGVSLSRGILDSLMAADWVRPMGRRRTAGRPVTYGTTDNFLVHFGLDSIRDLPGLAELKAAGFLENVNMSRLNLLDEEKPAEEQPELLPSRGQKSASRE